MYPSIVFMGLGGNSIPTSDDMKKTFLKKYKDYCKVWDIKEEIFKMSQADDEIMEDYVERFQYKLKIKKHNTSDLKTLRVLFLK